MNIPILRWGQPYTSLEIDEVTHFATGEPIARISRANGGLVQRDMRKAWRARDVLRSIPIDDLIARVKEAGELYANATLPMGDATQTPDEFVRAQSATTGIPERLCRANMKKNAFVLAEMRNILASLTRGLSLDVLTTGYGEERGVPISYQAQTPVLGLVFGSGATIEKYRGNPRVQLHGPGFSKILIGDDQVDNWEAHLDMLVESV